MYYDLAVLGGGPGGYTAAETAAKAGLRTVLFERKELGGVCLNEGCIPTKTLLHSAKVYVNAISASKYGVDIPQATFDFEKICDRKEKVRKKLVVGVGARMRNAGVDVVRSEARITGRLSGTGIPKDAAGCNANSTGIPKDAAVCNANGVFLIQAGEQTYEAASVIVSTGSENIVPPIPVTAARIDHTAPGTPVVTSRELLTLRERPDSLVIIGGGVIGMEFASFYNSMGSRVTVIEMMPKILGPFDDEISAMLQNIYSKRGVDFRLGCTVTAIEGHDVIFRTPCDAIPAPCGAAPAHATRDSAIPAPCGAAPARATRDSAIPVPCGAAPARATRDSAIPAPCDAAPAHATRDSAATTMSDGSGCELQRVTGDKILISVGRCANIEGLGLEALGVEFTRGRSGRPTGVKVDSHMRTNVSGLYAVGDVTGFSMLAHTAIREAEVAVHDILAGRGNVDRGSRNISGTSEKCPVYNEMNYDAVPAVVYTSPEVASVGLTEAQAAARGINVNVKKLPMGYSGRFVAENERGEGLCKIVYAATETATTTASVAAASDCMRSGIRAGQVLGVHMIGTPCSEIITAAAIAISRGLTLADLQSIIFPHPTVSEILRETINF